MYDFNWENMRHRDAQLENNSIREVSCVFYPAKRKIKGSKRQAAGRERINLVLSSREHTK